MVAVAYSGGLDSSVIARLASEFAAVRCYACAMAGSFDADHTPGFAAEEKMDLTMIEIKSESLKSMVTRMGALLDSDDPVRIAYTMPVVAVIERCQERTVLVGSGADELLGGYAKYVSAAHPLAMMRSDLDKMLSEDRVLRRAASSLSKRLESPFASERVVSMCAQLPMGQKIAGNERKILLRSVAQTLGLPSHKRQKKAAQYSSGIMREMKRQARRDGMTLSEWVSGHTHVGGTRPEADGQRD